MPGRAKHHNWQRRDGKWWCEKCGITKRRFNASKWTFTHKSGLIETSTLTPVCYGAR
jgi:hypothetical protein